MSDFFMNGTNGISVLVKNWDQKDIEFFSSKIFFSQLQAISNVRGGILSVSISIESLLEESIEYILFDVKDFKSQFFQEKILNNSCITFFEKWKIFKELTKTSPKTRHFYNSQIIKSIHEGISIRNQFAHWKLIFDFLKKTFYIEYIFQSEKQTVEITQEYLEASASHLYDCINSINILVHWDSQSVQKNLIKK